MSGIRNLADNVSSISSNVQSQIDSKANQNLYEQAQGISQNLLTDSIRVSPTKEVIALIAYLQRMGTDIGKNKTAQKQ